MKLIASIDRFNVTLRNAEHAEVPVCAYSVGFNFLNALVRNLSAMGQVWLPVVSFFFV